MGPRNGKPQCPSNENYYIYNNYAYLLQYLGTIVTPLIDVEHYRYASDQTSLVVVYTFTVSLLSVYIYEKQHLLKYSRLSS